MAKKKEINGIVPFTQEFNSGTKVGFKDLDGNVVIRAKYEEWGTAPSLIGGLATFVKGSKCLHGIINMKAEILIDDAYNTIVYEDGVGVFETLERKLGAINNLGETLVPCEYSKLIYLKDGFFYFEKDQKEFGILEVDLTNKSSKVKLDMKKEGYEKTRDLLCSDNGFLVVQRNGLQGLLFHGEELVPCGKYNGIAKCGRYQFWGIIKGVNGEKQRFTIDVTEPDNIKTTPDNDSN